MKKRDAKKIAKPPIRFERYIRDLEPCLTHHYVFTYRHGRMLCQSILDHFAAYREKTNRLRRRLEDDTPPPQS
jgi:hypothetical protein